MGKFVDLSGRRFGKLVVLERSEDHIRPNGRIEVRWKCVCDCGKETFSDSWSLTHGEKTSCGCSRHELLSASMKRTHERHPEIAKNFKKMVTTHGESKTRLYKIWCGIKSRCNDPGCAGYKNYGGRGIKICSAWEKDFLAFKEWALSHGYDESAPRGKCTIDRIDVNGEYSPENCRWVSQREQAQNKRTNHYITHNGETHSITEWGKILGINPNTIFSRAGWLGWPEEQALTNGRSETQIIERKANNKNSGGS